MKSLKLFEEGLSKLNIEFDSNQLSQIETFYNEINLFNPTYRLVNATSDELIIKHFLDSVSPYYLLTKIIGRYEDPIIADLGSGAGFPGIILATALKGKKFALIERSKKRAQFLQNCVHLCNLTERVEVIAKDFSQINKSYKIVTFRAVSPLNSIMTLVTPLLEKTSVVCAYKGKSETVKKEIEELNLISANEKWEVTINKVEVPFLDSERSLVILKKDS